MVAKICCNGRAGGLDEDDQPELVKRQALRVHGPHTGQHQIFPIVVINLSTPMFTMAF